MKITGSIHKILLPLTVMILLGACSRFIEGDVFLDKNANNVKDAGEPLVPGIPFSVTRNQEVKQQGQTDPAGHFVVRMGINDVDNDYCVQVSSEDVTKMKSQTADTGKSLKNLATDETEDTDKTCPFIQGKPDCSNANCCDQTFCEDADVCADAPGKCDQKSNGDPDCDDPDCCDASACKDATACQPSPSPDACPKDTSGAADCSDSRCADLAECDTHSVQAMKSCDKTKTTVLLMNLDVPVPMDYSSRISEVAETKIGPIAAGDHFGIEIAYPTSCKFDPITLPEALAPVGAGSAYTDSNHQLKLDQAVQEQPYQIIDQDVTPFGHDRIVHYVLKLEAKADVALPESDFKFQPTLTCPDGKKVSASSNLISFKNAGGGSGPAQTFSLSSEIIPQCPEPGESVAIHTDIEAQDPASYTDATFTLSVDDHDHLSIESMPGQCTDQGEKIVCTMDSLHLSASSQFSINFKMSDAAAPQSISFTADLEANGQHWSQAPMLCAYP